MVGLTPIVWAGFPSEILSAQLNAGTHGVSAAAASTAWNSTAAGWGAETAPGTGLAIGRLAVGMQGMNGLNANSALGRFVVWANEMAAQSALIAEAAQAHAAAYNAAWVAMPQPPQIAATDAAVAASHNPPGVLSGAAETADAAKLEMETQASAAMEVYDAASGPLSLLPVEFPMPPSITDTDYAGGGLASILGDLQQVLEQTPDALQQAGQAASSVASTGAHMVSMSTSAAAQQAAVSAPSEAGAVHSVAATPLNTTSAGLQGPYAPTSVSFPSGAGLPEGWGGMGTGSSGSAPMAGGPFTPSAQNTVPRTSMSPAVRRKSTDSESASEHETPDYLKNFEHFADGRTIVPSVIGEHPDTGDYR